MSFVNCQDYRDDTIEASGSTEAEQTRFEEIIRYILHPHVQQAIRDSTFATCGIRGPRSHRHLRKVSFHASNASLASANALCLATDVW